MMKEPEIKLFGRKISLPDSREVVAGGEYSGDNCNTMDCEVNMEEKGQDVDKENEADGEEKKEQGDDHEDNAHCESISDDKQENQATTEGSEDSTNDNDDDVLENHHKSETDQTEATDAQPKTLKKPNKILSCPRCNSMDTKFCYYNNYNVNQPRHFCKSCQRYWTAGGTMRNVPVGAGRRKNKNSTSLCHHIAISGALQVAQIDAPNGFHSPPNGTVLSFGPNSPLNDAIEKRVPNGFRKGDDTSNQVVHGGKSVKALPLPVPCIPGVFRSLPWSAAPPLPAICPSGYSIPFYPMPYFSGMPNPWNAQWMQVQSPSNPGTQLGKHSRTGELFKPNSSGSEERSSDSSIVVPKTLRIDDPEEAARSSIWTTLGIKYDMVRREGLFKSLQHKGDEKKSIVNTSALLQANPAALSRSICFRERA